MTRAQRVVIVIGLLVIAGLVLYPPWCAIPVFESIAYGAPLFDKSRLALECLLVVVVTGGIVFWLQGRRKLGPSD